MMWGNSDDNTWLDDFPVKGRKDAPLLFDRNLQAKPAYWAIVDPTQIDVFKQKVNIAIKHVFRNTFSFPIFRFST